jgi:hypothetical protein
MMQMLQAGGMPVLTDGERLADESNPRGYLELEAVKRTRSEAGWVAEAAGKAVKVIHLQLRDLPADYDYRVIFMRRNVDEVIASQQSMLDRMGRKGAGLPPDKLRPLMETQVRDVLAWMARQPNFTVMEVEHADAVYRPGSVAAMVNEFLGGGLDEAKLAEAADPKLHREHKERALASPL